MESSIPPFMYTPIQHRAGTACQNCRARKIKCNVTSTGTPCTPCDTHGRFCYIAKSKRGRKPRSYYKNVPHQSPVFTDHGSSPGTTENITGVGSIRSPISSNGAQDRNLLNILNFIEEGSPHSPRVRDIYSSRVPRNIYEPPREIFQKEPSSQVDFSVLHQELSYTDLISSSIVERPFTPPAENMSTTEDLIDGEQIASINSCEDDNILPDFIETTSINISSQDFEFLRQEDAFTIPENRLRNALVSCCCEYVYPIMPVVDLDEFLRALGPLPDNTKPKISILLLQAVMFSAVSFVDFDLIKDAGFNSRRAARRVYYDRAKLLYDKEAEKRPLFIVQALLLLTYCTERPGEIKEGWHWLGVAISLAISLGFHRNHPRGQGGDREWWQARRIWWTCYVRDRQHAQYLIRPLRIRDEDFDTPSLTLEDFDLDALEKFERKEYYNSPELFSSRAIFDKSTQRDQATIFIMMAELCIHIGGIVAVHTEIIYRERTPTVTADNKKKWMVPSKTWWHSDLANQISGLHWRLQRWFSDLPLCCIYQPPQQTDIARQGPSLFAYQALLHLAFHNTVSTLHRSQAVPPSQQGSCTSSSQGLEAWDHTYQASREVSRICRDLRMAKLDRFLPTTALVMQFSPIITQLSHLQDEPMDHHTQALQDIFHCVKLIETLQDLYQAGDFCIELMLAVLQRAKISVLIDDVLGIRGLRFRGVRHDFEDLGARRGEASSIASAKIYQQNLRSVNTPALRDEGALDRYSTSSAEQSGVWGSDSEFQGVRCHSCHTDQNITGGGTCQDTSGCHFCSTEQFTADNVLDIEGSTPSDDWLELLLNFESLQDTLVSA